MSDAPTPLNNKLNSINLLLKIPININPVNPNRNPKFINPCGIQKTNKSIMAIQISRDKNIQLKIQLKNKLELELYNVGELLKKIIKRTPVVNSTRGYLIDMDVSQLKHLPF